VLYMSIPWHCYCTIFAHLCQSMQSFNLIKITFLTFSPFLTCECGRSEENSLQVTSLQSQEILNRPVFVLDILKNVRKFWKLRKILKRFWTLLKILKIAENSENSEQILKIAENSEQILNITEILNRFWTLLKILNRFWTLLKILNRFWTISFFLHQYILLHFH
jgi:hypothetical protein